MITIVDYGLGNLGSIKNMLRRIGFASEITSDLEKISLAEKLILPGVGAFDNGMKNIRSKGLEPLLRKKVLEDKVPLLGICLGMQLLCDGSEEGKDPGLGWIPGFARKFKFNSDQKSLKIPHMGWNNVQIVGKSDLVKDFLPEMRFYFVHSYHVVCKNPENLLLTVDYGGYAAAAIMKDNIFGTQFHPEKSHKFGMQLLKNFAELHIC